MAAEGDLRERWDVAVCFLGRDICYQLLLLQPESSIQHLSLGNEVLDDWYSKVEQHYNEPHRAYHNLNHLQDVFSSLDILLPDYNKAVIQEQHRQSDMLLDDAAAHEEQQQQSITLKNSTIITLATFFHDVIYNPQSSTNEQDSADLFLNFVSDLINGMLRMGNNESNIPLAHIDSITKSSVVSQIKHCIIATASHIESAHQARMSPHNSGNTLLSAFLDADMSILGKDTNTYDKYAASIRKEYEFVDRSVYCEKRAEILSSFLPSTSSSSIDETKKQHMYIYATEKGRELWEMQARENLKREINMLRQGLIPLENN